MKRSIFNRKIPTLFGLLMLAVAVFTTSYLVGTGVIFFGHAAPTDNPENVRITNISDSSFTVTYATQAQVIGTISLATDGSKNTQTILDERDQTSGIPQLYNIHSIAVKNAHPSTTYTFTITSGTTTYQNNGNPFTVTTPATSTATPSATKPLIGKILSENGTIPKEALVFVTTTHGQMLSALTNAQGMYIVPLNTMLTNDLSTPISLTAHSVMQILATDGVASSQAQVLLSGANPVPLITLSNNYNFVLNKAPIASTAATLGFPTFPQSGTLTATPLIITPKKDQSFTDLQPQFTGKALPNQKVTIEIHSSAVITATVTSDAQGNWAFRPSVPLAPGQHILSITTKNAEGILTTLQQSFIVYASGSQVSQSATPSATLTPSATPTPTSMPTPTNAPTITSAPSISPTSVPTITTSVRPTLPATGSNALVVSSALGIVTTLVGVVLFVLTKGATL